MRTLLFLITFSVMATAGAANISCQNVDEYFEEDSLEFIQEGNTTYAYYFDNDSYYSIPCETTAYDGYICEDENFVVKMDESGDTVVEYPGEMTVEFQCQ